MEQIDGALEVDGSAYLVEIKWWGEPVETNAMCSSLHLASPGQTSKDANAH
ncbi:hypothetical protein [Streptomyces shenzhenensis]|uniref:hypothetical protein n=1 Tax=Streptomyces shenzhenensis TaxID=943815 RepID=UPI001F2231AB|nr:hypothetical protein [Streptomyces shenzhenensis]